ncbi:hypothetical protein BCU70_10805 [Vibrio sp. 10N.286.49.C2]|nr:hypothetical protein BCU70_10805 [Vibrio sp. 10N.286.49.C2]PMH45176.1 hypothetical protein BCU66_02405 [Vibrio sp. 10N.286.49.B1]PMH78910.1 hypothetical protein BCU58_07365 [Vibrio sp. 10N.286.48.B7]
MHVWYKKFNQSKNPKSAFNALLVIGGAHGVIPSGLFYVRKKQVDLILAHSNEWAFLFFGLTD